MINVVIVEDNKIINDSLSLLINRAGGFSCVGSFLDCESMLKKIKTLKPDIVLMDIKLPGMNGIEGVAILKGVLPELINISKDTVRFHIKRIYKKLHVHSQAEAVAKAIKKGYV